MKVIGITGGVGSGKTQVLEYLNDKYGASICLTDEVAKKLQRKGEACYDAIVEHFGEEILDKKGELNRSKLASIVFSDNEELAVLNSLVHPAVKAEVKKEIRKEERKNTNLFILESALLIDDDYGEICDEIWYVHVDAEIRKKRLMFARGYSAKRIDNIIASQMKKREYMMNCDRVIDNSGVFGETTMQLDQIIKDL